MTPLSVVTHVNDQPVHNMRQLVRLIKETSGDFVVFRFESEFEERVVLETELVNKYQEQILRKNNIQSPCSDDLKDLWP